MSDPAERIREAMEDKDAAFHDTWEDRKKGLEGRWFRPPVPVLWLDLETTGLDPKGDTILEVAADYHRKNTCYDLLGAGRNVWSGVVRQDRQPDWNAVHPKVVAMHEASGLRREVDAMGAHLYTLYEFEDMILNLTETNREDKIVLAGNTVGFDLGFVRAQMPRLAARLSHRVLDVSGPLMYGFPEVPAFAEPEAVHRAGPDVIRSQRIFLHFRRLLLG